MDYDLEYTNNDRSLSIWSCRYCGGNYAINKIKFEEGSLKDFKNVVSEPTKVLTLI
jgi:hypothetical protein